MRRLAPVLPLALLLLAAVAPLSAQAPASWLTEVASSYRGWGRVDDELRWAPWLCRLPLASTARVSRAESVHARRVYFVYASDRAGYFAVTRQRAAPRVGLTVVKESFHPRVIEDDALRGELEVRDDDFPYRAAHTDEGAQIGRGEAAGLFAMRYVGHRRGTDAGWVYGTLAADGTITADGVVESCAGCHRAAPHGRLFGLAQ